MVDFFKEYIRMNPLYSDWLFLFFRDWLPTIAFALFVIAIIFIKLSGEFDE